MRAALATLAAVALARLIACGPPPAGGDDAGIPDAGPYTAASVCDRIAAAQCDLIARCFPAFNRLSHEDCRTVQTYGCTQGLALIVDSVNAGRAKADEAGVTSCVDRMAQAPCPAVLPPTAPAIAARAFDECAPARLYVGSVPEGEVCRSPADCVPGAVCRQPFGTCAGVCVAYGRPGELCSGGCDPALGYCDRGQNPAMCTAYKTGNQPCQGSGECARNLACIGGTCLPPPAIGQTCDFLWDRVPYCGAGLACDVAPYVSGVSGDCILRGDVGAPCDYHWSCKENLVCRGMNWSLFPRDPPTPGQCGSPVAEGGDCAPTIYALYVGEDCAPGLQCDATTRKCLRRPKAGEACTFAIQNCIGADTWCSPRAEASPTCGPRPAVGESCAFQVDATRTVVVPCAQGWCNTQAGNKCQAGTLTDGQACTQNLACISGRCGTNEDRSRTCWPKCT